MQLKTSKFLLPVLHILNLFEDVYFDGIQSQWSSISKTMSHNYGINIYQYYSGMKISYVDPHLCSLCMLYCLCIIHFFIRNSPFATCCQTSMSVGGIILFNLDILLCNWFCQLLAPLCSLCDLICLQNLNIKFLL